MFFFIIDCEVTEAEAGSARDQPIAFSLLITV